MKSLIASLVVAMALGSASSASALAQAKKEVSPGAVTSGSTARALPGEATGSQFADQRAVAGEPGGPSAVMSGNAGVVAPNTKASEKARNN